MASLIYKLYYKEKKGNFIKKMDDAVFTPTCMTLLTKSKKSISEGFIEINPL